MLHAENCGEVPGSHGLAGASLGFFLIFSLVVFVAAAAPQPSPDEASLAAEVRSQGWVVYGARSTNGDWDLFFMRPDGSGIRPLTRTPEFSEFSPQFSPDGRKLLYRRMPRTERLDNNRHGEQGELVLANADGSDAVALGKSGEWPWASFSPDGSQIASLSIKGISFVSLESRQVLRTLPRKGFFQQMTWSPDGQWLGGVANSFGASWSIARMDIATGEASAVNRVDCCTPDWFPDSANLIFSWRPPGQKANRGYGWTQLWRATADGVARQLVYGEDGRHVYGGNVSPDGKYVLFTGNIEEDGDPGHAGAPMGLMRLSDAPIIGGEGTELRSRHPEVRRGPVLTLPAGWEPFWTGAEVVARNRSSIVPDAKTDAPRGGGVASGTPGADLAVVPTSSAMAAELREKGWLVFSAKTAAGDWDLFLMRPDGSGRRPLTTTSEFNEAGARFSPDGRRLLYYRMPKSEPVDNNNYGTFELVIAHADGRAPAVWGREFPWASWGPDSRQIACLTPKGIRIVDLETRAVIREYPRHGIVSQLVWSPEGKRFTGTANGLGPYWNIGCLDLATGEIRAVSETDRYNCTSDWVPGSPRIVYARGIIPQQPGRAELWAAAADGSERQRLYAETERHLYGACASPDGKFVLFTRSGEDLGRVGTIEMAIIRWPTAGQSPAPNSMPRLDLGPGWEPHWTSTILEK
jgi:Tol biopolymer transport system component